MKRRPVNRRRSASKFRKQVGRTKLVNLVQPMRGGIRL